MGHHERGMMRLPKSGSMLRAVSAFIVGLALAACGRDAQADGLAHLEVSQLDVPWRGVAVVDSREEWETLWRRYGGAAYAEDASPRGLIPTVDFSREAVVVAAQGLSSGCGNSDLRFFKAVREVGDSVVVELGVSGGRALTCNALIHVIDAVKVPSAGRRIVLHGLADWNRTPRWWDSPIIAELDAMPREERQQFEVAMTLDPHTPVSVLRELTRRATHDDWRVLGNMLRREDVRADRETVVLAAAIDGDGGRAGRAILLQRYPSEIARDSTAPTSALRSLLGSLRDGDPSRPELARLLFANPRVRNERMLFFSLINQLDAGPLQTQACRMYLSRWTLTDTLVGPDGLPSYATVPCKH